eukprot:COSAG02_NODE_8407_length_2583_cov_2.408615_4_plen_255_part_00
MGTLDSDGWIECAQKFRLRMRKKLLCCVGIQTKAFSRFSSSSGDIEYLRHTGNHNSREVGETGTNKSKTLYKTMRSAQGSEHLLNALLFFRRRSVGRTLCAAICACRRCGRGASRSPGDTWQPLGLVFVLGRAKITAMATNQARRRRSSSNVVMQGQSAAERCCAAVTAPGPTRRQWQGLWQIDARNGSGVADHIRALRVENAARVRRRQSVDRLYMQVPVCDIKVCVCHLVHIHKQRLIILLQRLHTRTTSCM